METQTMKSIPKPILRRFVTPWTATTSVAHIDRQGSVLLVVIGLLSLLLLAGIAFYTFASQENSSAEFYAEAADAGNPLKLSADELFEFGLEQLIIGPDESLVMSALRGGRIPAGALALHSIEVPGRHSLLAGVIGNDTAVYNGQGINLSTDMTGAITGSIGAPFVDHNHNGTLDPADDQILLNQINFSGSANGGVAPTVPMLPAPDTGYTAPDINSPYLAFIGNGIDYAGGGLSQDRSVIIPTFHRPQYLRGGVSDLTTPGNGNGPRIFRPHPDNRCPGGALRFLNTFPFSANPDGTPIKQGVWDPGTPSFTYNWDVDNDGDGVREGVWLDLDYPIQDLADGRSFVPMFSFTVIDSDGLINLNSSGNSVAWQAPGNPNSAPITDAGFVHRSNLGLSRSEINPLWGLITDATVPLPSNPIYFDDAAKRDNALIQARVLWNLPVGSTPSRIDTANIDFLSILLGRVDFTPAESPIPGTYQIGSDAFAPSGFLPGRRGESDLLSSAIAPIGSPKTTFISGSIPTPGILGYDDDNDSPPVAQIGHPIDYLGFGSTYTQGVGNAVTQFLLHPNATPSNPCSWPAYNGYANLASVSSIYGTFDGGTLLMSPQTMMVDEEDESVVDTEAQPAALNNRDAMFGLSEMFGLHGSNTDFAATSSTSRLRSLAHINFSDSKLAESIRKQYTVMSMDRLQFGLGANSTRSWEVNADIDSDTHLEFPPQFLGAACTDSKEPIRLPLRLYLNVEHGDNQLGRIGGFRLDMNRLAWSTNLADPLSGQTYLRELTQHPANPGTTNISTTYPPTGPAYPPSPTDYPAQEWWARHDRQLLARDLYVLLYILTSPDAAYSLTNDQKTEIAQFAVNYVDAMDTDENITAFEYDTNLTNGWNLDDDPYNNSDDSSGERGVVYGVETQSLTFSEALVIHTPALSSDRVEVTTFNDTISRNYAALELRNASPFPVNLANGGWRIRILNIIDPTKQRILTFRNGTIDHGATYAIGSRSGSDIDDSSNERPSDFRVNVDFTTNTETNNNYTYDTIVPAANYTVVAKQQGPDIGTHFDLDLKTHDDGTKFELVANEGGATIPGGTFIEGAVATELLTFVIERRLHISRSPLSFTDVTDNPWIEVDRMESVPVKEFALDTSSTEEQIRTTILQAVQSTERAQPFLRGVGGEAICNRPNLSYDNGAPPNGEDAVDVAVRNTIKDIKNNSSPASFPHWQPHFNRPFTSPMDVLTLPLFGPKNFTLKFSEGVTWSATPNFAQERFLRTINPADSTQNTWYRLLGLLGVPTRSQMTVNSSPYALRTPGLINLNTVRDRGVLAGLIDDSSTQFANGATNANIADTLVGHLNPYFDPLYPNTMLLDRNPDATDSAYRDWWAEFVASRDQRDPVTGLYLPGMAHSRPYRSLSYADSGAASIENTLLRGLPKDDPNPIPLNPVRRGIFEASYSPNTATDAVDLHTRHRLLRKVSNNSTTRSNVFTVWVSVGLFEATKTGNDVQIGGPINGTGEPTFRGFFVVDRSLPEQGLDQTGSFNFQRFIKYRKTIR